MSSSKNIAIVAFFVFFVFSISCSLIFADETLPSDFEFFTNDGIVSFPFDMAGYSDWWYWGNSMGISNRHDGSHEVLSGEWAVGIEYAVSGYTKHEWLTDWFSYPTWPTGTSFVQDSGSAWDSASNPVSGNDTARSIIHDPNIRVTIDYKIVDLGTNYASLPFYYQNSSTVAYVQSEKYILIQTYNLKNNRSSGNITGLKFYQLLVGLPTQSLYRSSTYSSAIVPGLLPRSYDPCNPGAANDFQYTITQWTPGDPDVDHVDWVTFASTIQPTWIENFC
jgi:hypothetical protein